MIGQVHAQKYINSELPDTPAPAGRLQRKTCSCGRPISAGGECAECRKKRLGLQRRAVNQSEPVTAPPIIQEVLRSPGRPLDSATRIFMESRFNLEFSQVKPTSTTIQKDPNNLAVGPVRDRFEEEADAVAKDVMHEPMQGKSGIAKSQVGYDFSQIRIHADARAAESARAVNALAYTVGRDVVFGAGQYAPRTTTGRGLLAHELAHTCQQSANNMRLVQRQFEIPIFDEFDPCIQTPLGKVCGSYAKTACEKVPSLPGCAKICKIMGCKKTEKPKILCPPGFKPGTAKGYEDMCCQGDIHNSQNCCPPDRIGTSEFFVHCCREDEIVVAGKCVKQTKPQPTLKCMPGHQLRSGECCDPPKVPDLTRTICISPPTPPKPPIIPPSPFTPVQIKQIGFKKDAPQSWFDPRSSYAVSVTSIGKTTFDQIAEEMKKQPALQVQLEGHASIEKPAKDPQYNQRLTERRVTLIAAELQKRGINESRIANVPGQSPAPGCAALKPGIYACGDVGADPTPKKEDRNVTAQVFSGNP